MFTPARLYLPRCLRVMPRRAKTVGQCATVVPVSARIERSRSVCQGVEGWWSRKMPWPMMARSSSSPCSCSQPIGVKPWRRVISWNSTTDCAAWICQEMPRRFASARLSARSWGVQVSIWLGTAMPKRRPDWCCSARSTREKASSIAFSPAFSSQAYSTTWPLRVNQRAERNIGAMQTRMPLSASRSSQPGCATERSATVVTPESSSSESATRTQLCTASGSGRKIGRYS